MEIEIVLRMTANNNEDSFDAAERDIKKFFRHNDKVIVGKTIFTEFYVMAAQPINVGEDGK